MSSLVLEPETSTYRTAPSQTETGFPPGVPYIIGNEAAERFSFYGMKSILAVFMAKYIMENGHLAPMSERQADGYTHYFVAGVYFLPILGALLSDGLLGKYRTILWLSIVYCFGHFALALNDTRVGLGIGLTLICFGAGGIKPCVSANVGDQFGASNKHLLTKIFGWFYFSINAGSMISSLLCPWLLENKGSNWAFGVPGIAMVVATFFFWLGRKKFVHVPPGGLGFVRDAISVEGRAVLGRLISVYVFIIIFWALWDQSNGVEWTLQAEKMDLRVPWLPWVSLGFSPFHFEVGMGLTLLAAQVQTANPILILLFIPLVNYVIYPAIDRFFPLTPLRKIGIGLFLAALSFVVIVYIQGRIDAGFRPNVNWQFLAYIIMTLAEAMVSITGLEFSYTQAPRRMKSAVMALWLFAVAAGNFFVAQFDLFIQNKDGSKKLTDWQFFGFFTLLMLVGAIIFIFMASRYQGQTYLQGEAEAEADIAAATNMPA